MKKVWIVSMLLLVSVMAFTQKSAPSKSTAKKVSPAKHKSPASKASTVNSNIPANAFHFKESEKQDAEIEGNYAAIVVEGDHNKITVSDGTSKIFVKGKGNDISMVSADYIEITGDGNFVSWEKSANASGKPVVLDKGGYNNVGKRTGEALDKDDQ